MAEMAWSSKSYEVLEGDVLRWEYYKFYEPPILTTEDATDIGTNIMTANGTITSTGYGLCSRRGFCYMLGTSGDPTIANSVVYEDGSFSTGAYDLDITGLTMDTSYRIRAYAVNIAGTAYGNTVQAITSAVVRDRGVFGGGWTGANQKAIEYITISTTGNGTHFGDLTVIRYGAAGCASSTRGVFGGGYNGTTYYNTIDYITIIAAGNATDFGDLTQVRYYNSACSNETIGVFAGGLTTSAARTNVMDYITIASTGNATDFGDLTATLRYMGGCASPTRGIFGGGTYFGVVDTIDYITIGTPGNAAAFGYLTLGRSSASACSSSTRGIFGGGSSTTNVIDYITIATTGDATDFGDLTVARYNGAAVTNSTRGVFGGGYTTTNNNTIDYVTIATTGNATDFGDMYLSKTRYGSCSDCHGGL